MTDINSIQVGPNTAAIDYSTVKFTPSVTNQNLEVFLNLSWNLVEELAVGDKTEMAACWKRNSAGWVCFWTERTIASNDEFIDDQRAFTTTTIPSTGDFTNHKSMALTKGWAAIKYTEIWKCASQ